MNDVVLGSAGTLTGRPTNKVALQEDLVVLECSTDTSPNGILWRYGSASITRSSCTSIRPGFTTRDNGVAGDCYLLVQGTNTSRRSGPYTCYDGGAGKAAQAVVIVIGQYDLLRFSQRSLYRSFYRRQLGHRRESLDPA